MNAVPKPSFKLRKPKYIKINDIAPGKHCYHVYAKIVSLTKTESVNNNGEKFEVAEGRLGDESGVANFLLRGPHAANLEEGQIVSLRNGKSNVVNDHIRLELDRFGKVSQEPDVQIESVDLNNDISAEEYVLKRRR